MLYLGVIEASNSHWNSLLVGFPRAKMELTDAFWQIPLSEESKDKSRFTVPRFGFMRFNRLYFGLSNTAQSLARVLDIVLAQIQNLFIRVLRRSNYNFVNFRAKYFSFRGSRFTSEYLGYLINELGLKIDWSELAPILDLPVPDTVKKVRSFLQMVEWFSRFILNTQKIFMLELRISPKKLE